MKALLVPVIVVLTATTVRSEVRLERGHGVVTVPERFELIEKSVSDEGDIRAEFHDAQTGLDATVSLNSRGLQGLGVAEVDWLKVIHFERGPRGWYDGQTFVFEHEDHFSVESRHAFQSCMFRINVPKDGDWRPAIEGLRSIRVELADGWKLIIGKKPASFLVIPEDQEVPENWNE